MAQTHTQTDTHTDTQTSGARLLARHSLFKIEGRAKKEEKNLYEESAIFRSGKKTKSAIMASCHTELEKTVTSHVSHGRWRAKYKSDCRPI